MDWYLTNNTPDLSHLSGNTNIPAHPGQESYSRFYPDSEHRIANNFRVLIIAQSMLYRSNKNSGLGFYSSPLRTTGRSHPRSVLYSLALDKTQARSERPYEY